MKRNLTPQLRRILKLLGLSGVALSIVTILVAALITILIQQIFPGNSISVAEQSVSSATGYEVLAVIDGDTIKVDIDPTEAVQSETVRLIGIDAPELAKARVAAECKASESTAYLKSLIDDGEVRLESDPSQTDRDRYGRLLRFVFVGEENANLKMLEAGLAKEYTYSKAYFYQAQFKRAESDAKISAIGVWSPGCQNYVN